MPFLGFDDRSIKFQTFHYRDQVAVLVGGFRTEDEAVKALAKVKKWNPPADERLMDVASINSRSAGLDKKFIHPYATAMIVQNPTIVHERGMEPESELEPFVIKYNENRPYSLLQTTKRWTIAVQSFSAPVRYVSKESSRMVGRNKEDADILMAGEKQADMLARGCGR